MKIPKIVRIATKSGLVRFRLRFLVDGRGSKNKNLRFDSRQEAQEFIVKMLDKRKATATGSCLKETTFAAEADYWLGTRGKSVSPSHLKKVKGILAEILPQFGRMKSERFNHGLLADFQSAQLDLGWKGQTVNHKVQVIKAVLRNSQRTRRIAENPAAGFEMLKVLRDNIDFWERSEAEAFLGYANQKYPKGSPERWVYAVYLLALNTGIRAGEVWGLLPSNIKSGGKVLYINHQFDRTVCAMRPPKGKEPRNVPCNTDLHAVLLELAQTNRSSRLGTIFYHPETGDPVCQEVFRRRYFARDMEASGTRKIRFHDLRHTAATLMIDRGIDLVTVSKILGHKDMKTTMLYLHLLPNKIAETGLIFSVTPQTVGQVVEGRFPKVALVQA